MKFNGIVYDVEIIKAIPNKKDPKIEGIEYCEGWGDHKGMGISVICAYDYVERRFRAFCKDNFDEFQTLVDASDWVAGFNIINFDNKVCAANGIAVPEGKSYDILRAIWKAAGLDPTIFNSKTHGGFSLDAVADLNLGRKKTGHGALAPIEWQQGKYGSVIDYCLEDVRLEARLLNQILNEGKLMNPKDGKVLHIERPQ